MNCGKDAGSSAVDWCPYIPPGMTARARSRSRWSTLCSVVPWGCSVMDLLLFTCLLRCFDPAGHIRLRAAEEVKGLAEALDAGVRPEAGGGERAAGDAKPRGVDAAGPGEQPGEHARGEGEIGRAHV